jgi:hypothetical protein
MAFPVDVQERSGTFGALMFHAVLRKGVYLLLLLLLLPRACF